jgi:hypothetical protein
MRIKKGIYKIAHAEGFHEEEGSYALCFPLYIHRSEEEKLWKVSHYTTGYNIKAKLPLVQAKTLAKAIKDYPLFLTPTIDTFNKQKEIMHRKHPQQFKELLNLIATNGEPNE